MDVNLFVRPCSTTIQLQRDRLARREPEVTRIGLELNLSGFIAEPAALDEIVIVGQVRCEDGACRSTVHHGDRWVEAGRQGEPCSQKSGTRHQAVLGLWRLTRLTSFPGHSEVRLQIC